MKHKKPLGSVVCFHHFGFSSHAVIDAKLNTKKAKYFLTAALFSITIYMLER